MILQSPIVTLTTCDTEPIHLLGAIQPFGFLLTVNAEWVVVRASDNVEAFLGQPWGRIVGQPFEKCLSADLLHDIRGCLQIASGSSSVECILGKRLHPKGPTFDIAVHQSGREVVLEFEPSSSEVTLSLATLRGMVARVERQILPEAMYREAARQVRALTGFDRVMVYRFDHDGAGEVVGELMTGGLSPFLGLRYPAADIPLQARALYERNYIRIITDVDAQPVPVAPALSPEGEKLDLSMSVLRSVSPIHIEYLKNMGVYASMSISILQGGKLWGLIACHHNSPKNLSLETRSTAELFGRMLSYLLEVRHRDDEASHDARAAEIQSRLAFAFAEPNSSMRNIAEFLAETGDYIAADGIGTYHSGEIALTGLTPTRDEFLRLVRFLDKTASGRVYATHNLSDVYPPAADFVMRAAGVLSIPISRTPRDYLVFFRREVIKTVTWAGEPAKVGMIGPNGPRLTPRKSFAAWQESVHNQCKPWGKRDVRVAEALRLTLVELVLRMAEAAEADRLGAHQHQEILIAELNHRIRNILGLVRGLVTQSAAASTNDHATFVKSFDARIRSLARSHDLLTSNFWKPASFHALVKAEIATYGAVDKRLSLIGPDVLLEPKAFTTVALLVHELVTNAQKHGALSELDGRVILETSQDDMRNICVSWRETGGPPVSPPKRRGFGSTLLEQLVPFELNGLSHPMFLPQGFAMDLVLPAMFATRLEALAENALMGEEEMAPVEAVTFPELLHTSLVVEDNLFIAIDAEEMLRELGAGVVVVTKSVADALAQMASKIFSFALLDVNLGPENSLPVARSLRESNIPCFFGTGYGDGVVVPNSMKDVPIVSKPYNKASFIDALQQLRFTRVLGASTGSETGDPSRDAGGSQGVT